MKGETESRRFWEKVQIGESHECWPWIAGGVKSTALFSPFGRHGNSVIGKRYLMEILTEAPLADDEFVLQDCGNTSCLNPRHLRIVNVDQYEEERFESFILKIPFCTCWLWTGAAHKQPKGRFAGIEAYGVFGDKHRHQWKAHRWAYHHYVGNIPDGMLVIHVCDTPLCVRHDHLRLGTHADNSADMRNKGRSAKGILVGNAKLTDEQARQIRVRGHESSTVLGREFGLDPSTIRDVVRGETWRHVTV